MKREASVALSLCTTAHLLHTGVANIFGASLSEAAMRPDPRRARRAGVLGDGNRLPARSGPLLSEGSTLIYGLSYNAPHNPPLNKRSLDYRRGRILLVTVGHHGRGLASEPSPARHGCPRQFRRY